VSGVSVLRSHLKISPGKYNRFPLTYLPHLHHGIRAVLDFALYGKLIRPVYAFYAVPVRQTEGLPSASFRFHLTMDTLAVRLEVPTAKSSAVFHRLAIAHAGRTCTVKKAVPENKDSLFKFTCYYLKP
jgi:hypothetical protein